MQEHKRSSSRRDRPRGEVAAALVLALGAFIERARAPRSGWVAAVPIVIVNYVAFRAQLRFWQAHLGPADAFLVSVALETVAVYLAWQAHRALVKDDSALRLRAGAYGIALFIGLLNYSHYMKPGWRPTVAAVTFGAMSAISPWLWSIHSRRESRDDLKARDLIEDHGVRLGFSRWFWYPLRSAMVQRRSAWAGENRPAAAIALYEDDRAERRRKRAERHRKSGGDQIIPEAAPQTPPPAHSPREPRPRRVSEARTGELAAASEREAAVALRLIARGGPLPSERKLANDPEAAFPGGETARRNAAKRTLQLVRAQSNGHGRGDPD
jgi:hypothetical protein